MKHENNDFCFMPDFICKLKFFSMQEVKTSYEEAKCFVKFIVA